MSKYQEKWLESALSDLDEILDYLIDNTQDPELVIKTEDSIRFSIATLLTQPEMGIEMPNNKRKLILKKVPFIVVYEIKQTEIWIWGITHQSRKFPDQKYG